MVKERKEEEKCSLEREFKSARRRRGASLFRNVNTPHDQVMHLGHEKDWRGGGAERGEEVREST